MNARVTASWITVLGTAAACASHDAASVPEAGVSSTTDAVAARRCSGAVHTSGAPAGSLPKPPALTLAAGFTIEVIASVASARQLVALPNGDLLVSTKGSDVWIVPNAEASGAAAAPILFTSGPDVPVQGIAFQPETCTVAIASQHSIYAIAYSDGQTSAALGAPIASIRTGPVAHAVDASVDTDTHMTTSLAFSNGKLYAGVGSSCNACVEVDPTRATVQEMNIDGSGRTTKATRIRNAIAMATNPATGTLWVGGAGQDELPLGHPYEFFDALTVHAGSADYGWPACEENGHAYVAGADCSATAVPRVELPAYSTLIGAAFYPTAQAGAYAFPAAFRGGVFLTAHGSWHTLSNHTYYSPPRVAYLAMHGDTPVTPVDWNDPTKQWAELVGGFQLADGITRIGRPTGAAVGVQGSLFVADDQNGYVYRIRPG